MINTIREDAITIAKAPLPYEKLAGKTILITGANGYVPAYFVHGLLAHNDLYGTGIQVIALCRSRERAEKRFADYLDRADFRLLIQDATQPLDLAEDDRVDYYIHAASPAGMKDRYAHPANTFNANVIGLYNVLERARTKGADGVLFLSSVDVYGDTGSDDRLVEADCGLLDTLGEKNVYTCGKRAGEAMSMAYVRQYGLRVVIARPFQAYGPGIALDDGRLHADFINQLKAGDEILLKSDGTSVRSFQYITDTITGLLTLLLKGNAGEAYNVVDEGGEATVLELAQTMIDLLEGRTAKIVFADELHGPAVHCVIGDSAKLRALGWKPATTLKDGLGRMMACYGLDVQKTN